MRLHILAGMIDELEKIGVSHGHAGFMQARRGTRPYRVDTLLGKQPGYVEPNTVSQAPELDRPPEPQLAQEEDEGDPAVGKTAQVMPRHPEMTQKQWEEMVRRHPDTEVRLARSRRAIHGGMLGGGLGLAAGGGMLAAGGARAVPYALGASGIGTALGAGIGRALPTRGIRRRAEREAEEALEESKTAEVDWGGVGNKAMHGFAGARPYVVGGLQAGVPAAVLGNIVGGRRLGAIGGLVGTGLGVTNEFLKQWAAKNKRRAVAKKLLAGQE